MHRKELHPIQHILCQRALSMIFVIFLCMCLAIPACASSWIDDAQAINDAAKSVLMLEIYNGDGTLIATGSGFVAFNSGTLITNHHVIEGGSFVRAISDDGESFAVNQILCANQEFDIAILSFSSSMPIEPLPLFYGQNLLRSEAVVAIGSPIGIANTISMGNISALYNEGQVPWIQFTAPISSGSSGGALLNKDGYVIGITSASYIEGEDMNLAVHISAVQAMYHAWDGKTHTVSKAPTTSQVNYNAIPIDALTATNTPSLQPDEKWTCTQCTNVNATPYCLYCGTAKPEWTCLCGQKSSFPFCGYCGSSVQSLLIDFNKAYQAMLDGQYEQALARFQTLSSFHCGTYDSLAGSQKAATDFICECTYLWGSQLLHNRQYEEAILKLNSITSIYPDAYGKIQQAYYLLAEEHLAQKQYEDASVSFALAGDYQDAASRINEPFYHQGLALAEEGQRDKALAAFEKCNDYGDAREQIASLYVQINEEHYLRAEVLLTQGKYEEASAAFELAGDYKDASSRIFEPFYLQGLAYAQAGQNAKAIASFEKSNGYKDALVQIQQIYYRIALEHMNDREYELAIKHFGNAAEYLDSNDKLIEASCLLATAHLENQDFDQAIAVFSSILSSQDASQAQKEQAASDIQNTYHSQILHLIDTQQPYEAYQAYCAMLDGEFHLTDPLLVVPGDSSGKALWLLQRGKDLGFIKQNITKVNEYSSEYTKAIMKMEDAFNLEADGQMKLSEYVVLSNILYPGCTASSVAPILEQLWDLGYITAALPESHTTYEKSFAASIKRAEKTLKLKQDGFLTLEEQQVILKQIAQDPSKVKKFTAKEMPESVQLSWSKVKGAVWYDLFKNEQFLASVQGTEYTDIDIQMGNTYHYDIVAHNYTKSSEKVRQSIQTKITYLPVSAQELFLSNSLYMDQYVKVAKLRTVHTAIKGNDLQATAISGAFRFQLIFPNYYMFSWPPEKEFVRNSRTKSFWVEGKVGHDGTLPTITVIQYAFQ